MALYELIGFNTDNRYLDDIRYRAYTTSEKKAELFKQIPRIQFTDSGHGIVFDARIVKSRKPEIWVCADHVNRELAKLKPARTGGALCRTVALTNDELAIIVAALDELRESPVVVERRGMSYQRLDALHERLDLVLCERGRVTV